jgi:hypothetical protein
MGCFDFEQSLARCCAWSAGLGVASPLAWGWGCRARLGWPAGCLLPGWPGGGLGEDGRRAVPRGGLWPVGGRLGVLCLWRIWDLGGAAVAGRPVAVVAWWWWAAGSLGACVVCLCVVSSYLG